MVELSKVKRSVSWSPPDHGSLMFNVDGAARGKLEPAGIGCVLRNEKGKLLFMFPKHVCYRFY